MPDTNAFLSGMDLFESEAAFRDVVVLQTVLEEVKNRSLPLYHRLIALTKDEDRRYYVFFNEFRLETHIERHASESINDRNDRAVRKAVQWYNQHLQNAARSRGTKLKKCPSAVMISDDLENVKQAQAAQIPAIGCASFSVAGERMLILYSACLCIRPEECG